MANMYILQGSKPKEPLYNHSVGIKLFNALKKLSNTDKIAFINVSTNDCITYKNLFHLTVKVAIMMKNHGLAGNIIGVFSENSTDFFVPIIAAMYIGSPVTTFNNGYTTRELLHACELVKPTTLFCSASTYNVIEELKRNEPMKYLEKLWILQDLLTLVDTDINVNQFQPIDVNPKEHIAMLMFSSGTTGLPKAVAITHRNISFCIRQSCDSNHGLSELNNYLMCMPFYHGYGFQVTLITLLKGNPIKFLEKFDPIIFLSAIEKYKINFLTLVPPLMVFLAKHPIVDNYNLKSVKIISCSAALCSAELEIAVSKRLKSNIMIYQAYGLTESTTSAISVQNKTKAKNGSVGTVDSGVEIKFRDLKTSKSLGPNNIGEICIRSDSVMKEYYCNPIATKATITRDGWLLTGDLGYYDMDGFIFIVDRLKELIKFKGFQVPPAELEALLSTHPKVMDSAVVGLPDEAAGELPLAFVVKKPGVDLNEQEIVDFIKGHVSYVKQLHGGVRFVESIPKSPAGKILRRKLRDLLITKSGKSKLHANL